MIEPVVEVHDTSAHRSAAGVLLEPGQSTAGEGGHTAENGPLREVLPKSLVDPMSGPDDSMGRSSKTYYTAPANFHSLM